MSFKSKFSFEDRKIEAQRIKARYPDRIPIICEKDNKSNIKSVDKIKYLVPFDLTVGQFIYTLRKRMKLSAEEAIFLFINGSMTSNDSTIQYLYETERDADEFLYIIYSSENVFG